MKFLNKFDLFLALIIGEAAAWLMFLIGLTLALENPAIASMRPMFKFLPIVFPVLCAGGLIAARLAGRVVPVAYQLAKFALVGGLNFLIDLGIVSFLIFFTGISAGALQSLFKALSFCAATVNSYFWNKRWVFGGRKTEAETDGSGREFAQFFLVSVIGFAINVGVNYFFVNHLDFGLPPRTWAQAGAMFAAIASLFWNFAGYKFIVFKKK